MDSLWVGSEGPSYLLAITSLSVPAHNSKKMYLLNHYQNVE
jgi:hypothetical protein